MALHCVVRTSSMNTRNQSHVCINSCDPEKVIVTRSYGQRTQVVVPRRKMGHLFSSECPSVMEANCFDSCYLIVNGMSSVISELLKPEENPAILPWQQDSGLYVGSRFCFSCGRPAADRAIISSGSRSKCRSRVSRTALQSQTLLGTGPSLHGKTLGRCRFSICLPFD